MKRTLPHPVSWGFRIYLLHLCRGLRPLPNEFCVYDGEVTEMPVLWGMQSTPSLPSLPGQLRSGVVAPDKVLFMGQIEINCVLVRNKISTNRIVFTYKLRTNAELNCLKLKCFFACESKLFEMEVFLTLKLYLR